MKKYPNTLTILKRPTHTVLDLTLTVDEGQEVFNGTIQECDKFISEQNGSCSSMYTNVPYVNPDDLQKN